ncbi:MAG: hypothetical protein WCG87_03825 [Bacteroidota bacterium]
MKALKIFIILIAVATGFSSCIVVVPPRHHYHHHRHWHRGYYGILYLRASTACLTDEIA